MRKIIKEDIISVLTQVVDKIDKKEYSEIEELSNHVIHDASIFQDEDSISIAVLIYSIYKVLTKYSFNVYHIKKALLECINYLKKDDITSFRDKIRSIFRIVETIDKEFSSYVDEVINKAKIKKAVKIYDHGISLARAAEILNISQWELLNYLGNVREKEEYKDKLDVAEEIFGIKK